MTQYRVNHDAVAQARRFGAEILSPMEAVKLESRDGYHVLTLSNGAMVASARAS